PPAGAGPARAALAPRPAPPGVGPPPRGGSPPPRYGRPAVPCALVLLVWTAQRRPALLAIAGIAVLAFYWQVSAWDRIDVILAQLDGWAWGADRRGPRAVAGGTRRRPARVSFSSGGGLGADAGREGGALRPQFSS